MFSFQHKIVRYAKKPKKKKKERKKNQTEGTQQPRDPGLCMADIPDHQTRNFK